MSISWVTQFPVVPKVTRLDPAYREQRLREAQSAWDAIHGVVPPRTRPILVIDNTRSDVERMVTSGMRNLMRQP